MKKVGKDFAVGAAEVGNGIQNHVSEAIGIGVVGAGVNSSI